MKTLLAVLHGDALAGGDALAADVGAVGAAAVLDEELAALRDDVRVVRRDLRVRDDDVVVGRAADGDESAGELAQVELAEDRAVLPARRARGDAACVGGGRAGRHVRGCPSARADRRAADRSPRARLRGGAAAPSEAAPCAICMSSATGIGTGPKAMMPFGSIGTGWFAGIC